MKAHAAAALILFLCVAPAALAQEEDLVNLAPYGRVYANAQVFPPTRVNDLDPGTTWSAWPYTLGGKNNAYVFELTLPWPAEVSRIEWDLGVWPPKEEFTVLCDGKWEPAGARIEVDKNRRSYVWTKPRIFSAIHLEFPDVHKLNTGIAVTEMRILGRLPEKLRPGKALEQGEAPILDWTPIKEGLSVRASGGDGKKAVDGWPLSTWDPGKTPCPWIEVKLNPPRRLQRVEMGWVGTGYAVRSVLELRKPGGDGVVIARDGFCTSFTLSEPMMAESVRLTPTQTPREVSLGELRLFGPGPPAKAPAEPQVKLWAETPIVHVKKDRTGPDERSPRGAENRALVMLACNEYEPAQIAVRNESDAPLRNLTLVVDDLQNKWGRWLTADNITWNPLGWVNGEHPDVLTESGPFEVAAGETRPVWLTVYAPPRQTAGVYRGEMRLVASGRTLAAFNLVVQVWDIGLPKETAYETHYFAIWGTGPFLRKWEKEEESHRELQKRTAEQFARHRVSPGNVFTLESYEKRLQAGPWERYIREFDEWAQYWVDKGIPFVGVLHGGPPRLEVETAEQKWKFWEKHLKEKGWIDKFSVRVGDEPPPKNQKVTNACKQFIEWAPDLRRQCAFSSFGKGMECWDGLVNEWGIRPRYYGETRMSDLVGFCQERLKRGDGVSYYVHDAFSVDRTPYFTRMFFWFQWKTNVLGGLLYAVAEWEMVGAGRWDSDFVINGGSWKSWGTILWPGREGLLNSVRFENVRDGIEDIEMNLILKRRLEELAEKSPEHGLVKEGRRLLTEMDDIYLALDKPDQGRGGQFMIHELHADSPMWCTNAMPGALLDRRAEIAGMIMKVREELRK